MDMETVRTLADLGLGACALVLYARQGKILANHEVRLTAAEIKLARRQPKKKR